MISFPSAETNGSVGAWTLGPFDFGAPVFGVRRFWPGGGPSDEAAAALEDASAAAELSPGTGPGGPAESEARCSARSACGASTPSCTGGMTRGSIKAAVGPGCLRT